MNGRLSVKHVVATTLLFVLCQALSSGLITAPVFAQAQTQPTKTIIGDLLDIDRGLYIVRGPMGEIQIEVTSKTEVTEKFEFGDRIKALVDMNDKAFRVERAGPGDINGEVINQPMAPARAGKSKEPDQQATVKAPVSPQPAQPDTKIVIGDVLMVDGAFYVLRSEFGEIRVEKTSQTQMTESFKFGDRIKAKVLMNDKALSIERAGPQDVPGVTVQRAAPPPVQKPEAPRKEETPVAAEKAAPPAAGSEAKPAAPAGTKVIEGEVLMVDGDFYILRGERGEISIERTGETKLSEQFKFGDRIKATVLPNMKALSIERAK